MPDEEDKKQNGGEDEGEKSSRLDSAKAFFRAIYAGEESTGASNGSGSAADSQRVKDLELLVRELEQKASDAENHYRRMAADFDNFRRRTEREREDFMNAGVRKAAESILPALDDLDRALLYLSADSSAEKIIESFKLVASRINQCLEHAGLKRLETVGYLFDPRFHEPVQQIETTNHPDGTILQELRGGYTLGEKVIRPAMVNVSSNPEFTGHFPTDFETDSVAEAPATGETAAAVAGASAGAGESGEEPKVYDLGNMDDLT